MGLLTCPACGTTSDDAEPTCPSCLAALTTAALDPGMAVAADQVESDPDPARDGAADIDHEHGEASATTLLQSDPSIEESSGRAGAQRAPGDSTPARPATTGASPTAPSAYGAGISSRPIARSHRTVAMLWQFRVLIAAAALCASLAVLLQVRPGQRMQRVVAKPPQPTATATVAPSPTTSPQPMAGYTWYVDSTGGYMVQYPTSWTKTADPNQGMEFSDGSLPTTGIYLLQVSLPDPNTSGVPSKGDSNVIAATWVDFELSSLEQNPNYGQTLHRVPGPIPAAMIGGQSWQSGIATVDLVDNGQTVPIRLQVFATIHNGRPYIINVYARTDLFATGEQQYFTPILNTFQFLLTSAQGS